MRNVPRGPAPQGLGRAARGARHRRDTRIARQRGAKGAPHLRRARRPHLQRVRVCRL